LTIKIKTEETSIKIKSENIVDLIIIFNFLLKISFTKCGSSRYFSGSLAVFEERGEPACGRAANYGGLFSPPQAAKNVRTNLRIVHLREKVNFPFAASLRSAAKLKGKLKEKINFWSCNK